MISFITEAAVVGLKEALKLSLVWFVYSSFLSSHNEKRLIRPFYAGLAIASLLSLISLFFPPDLAVKASVSKLIGYVFFFFFLGSVLVLYQASAFKALWGKMEDPLRYAAIVFLTAFYFSPDIIGSSMFIKELSVMKEAPLKAYSSALLGFISALLILFFSLKRFRAKTGRFFDIGQLLLFLSVVKLLGGGIEGFAELSLIPSVERGIMKFVHDFVHQTFVYLLVPDHPLLRTTVWSFIGIFFGSNFAMFIALGILLLPPAIFLYSNLKAPLQVPESLLIGAEKRKVKALQLKDRLRKSVPVILFVPVIFVSWYGSGEDVSRLYNPAPKPVVSDKGIVMVPLTDPTMDLLNGKLHKFSILIEDENIVFLIIKRPDGKLSVCLDACEICPPVGYGQSEGDLVCIYCKTPIPIETLGKPGGCNPIPLDAVVAEKDIVIDVKEIARKWQDVKTGEAKGELRE